MGMVRGLVIDADFHMVTGWASMERGCFMSCYRMVNPWSLYRVRLSRLSLENMAPSTVRQC